CRDRAGELAAPTSALHLLRAGVLDRLDRKEDAQGARQTAPPPRSALDFYRLGIDLYNRGFESSQAGELQRGTEQFQQVLRLEPGHFWAHYYLALCHLKLQ